MRNELIPPLLGYYTMVSSGRDDGIVESGLVVEYKFDEGTGTTVVDHVSGYDMTLGATTAAPAWDTYGLDFDGSNDYITAAVPDSVFLGASGFTAIVVAQHDSFKNANYFMGKGTAATNTPIDWRCYGTSVPGQIFFTRSNATISNTHKRIMMDYGEWRMFGMTVADNDIVTQPYHYINAFRMKATITNSANTGEATGNNTELRLGYNTTRYLDGHAAYVLIYNRELSRAEMEQNYSALITILAARSITLPAAGVGLVFIGDSLTSGTGISAINEDYPSQLMVLLGDGYNKLNIAIPGVGFSTFAPDGTNVDDTISTRMTRNICIFWGGSNDIDSGVAATTVYANLETYVAARKAAGFDDVIVLTALDRAQYDAAQRIQYAAYNTLIRDGAATGGYTVADVDGDERLQDYTDTTYFNADQVHLIAAGYAVVAGIVKTAIEAVMAA
jgi:lysophospholipase L1-like esterase